MSVIVLMRSLGDNSCLSPHLVAIRMHTLHARTDPSTHPAAPSSREAPPSPLPRGGAPRGCRPPAPPLRSLCPPLRGQGAFGCPLTDTSGRAPGAWQVLGASVIPMEKHGSVTNESRGSPEEVAPLGLGCGASEQDGDPQGTGNSSVVTRGLQQNLFLLFCEATGLEIQFWGLKDSWWKAQRSAPTGLCSLKTPCFLVDSPRILGISCCCLHLAAFPP